MAYKTVSQDGKLDPRYTFYKNFVFYIHRDPFPGRIFFRYYVNAEYSPSIWLPFGLDSGPALSDCPGIFRARVPHVSLEDDGAGSARDGLIMHVDGELSVK
jgi:hypothetical protein